MTMTSARIAAPGELRVEQSQRELSAEECSDFYKLLAEAHLERLDAKNDVRGPDGDTWLFEERRNGAYRVTERWEPAMDPSKRPELGGFVRLGAFMLQLDPSLADAGFERQEAEH